MNWRAREARLPFSLSHNGGLSGYEETGTCWQCCCSCLPPCRRGVVLATDPGRQQYGDQPHRRFLASGHKLQSLTRYLVRSRCSVHLWPSVSMAVERACAMDGPVHGRHLRHLQHTAVMVHVPLGISNAAAASPGTVGVETLSAAAVALRLLGVMGRANRLCHISSCIVPEGLVCGAAAGIQARAAWMRCRASVCCGFSLFRRHRSLWPRGLAAFVRRSCSGGPS